MYFNEKGNTDIDDELKYRQKSNKIIKKKAKNIYPYFIFLGIFLLGIIMIIIGTRL